MSAAGLMRRSSIRGLSARKFSTNSTTPPPIQSTTTTTTNHHSSNSNSDSNSNSRGGIRWISGGIISSCAVALSLNYYSSSTLPLFPSSSIALADSLPSTAAALPQSTLLNHNNNNNTTTTQSRFLFGDAYRRKIFFNYEKRIRMRSPPEKVFEYFASVRGNDGEIFMTPADLMRALVPVFPPSESQLVRDGYLRGERNPGELRCDPSQFFMLFDTDNDGLISFKEYLFFVTLLSIPEASFSVAFKMFDIDCNGEIDSKEFKKVMTLMRAHNRQGAAHSEGLRAGHKFAGSIENGGLLEYFFGKDGKQPLQHDKFVQFLKDLHNEMVRLEFAHYDYKLRGTISAKDFALSMVASADLKHLSKLLDRVDDLDKLPHFDDIRITPEEFRNFAELRRKLQPFTLALFSFGHINGLLTRKDFQRAAEQVCGVPLTENVIELIFHVFDTNKDGSLSANEFVRVLHKREKDIAEPTEAGLLSFLSCCWHCKNAHSITGLLS